MLEPVMVEIPEGFFKMGTDGGNAGEAPRHEVFLPRYEIGLYPVTNRYYESFLAAHPERAIPLHWDGRSAPTGTKLLRMPVGSVSSWTEPFGFPPRQSGRKRRAVGTAGLIPGALTSMPGVAMFGATDRARLQPSIAIPGGRVPAVQWIWPAM